MILRRAEAISLKEVTMVGELISKADIIRDLATHNMKMVRHRERCDYASNT